MTRKLRPYQDAAVDFGCANPRFNLWAGMGTGKTAITWHILDAFYKLGELQRPTLIIAPRHVAEHTWTDELARWPNLDMQVSTIVGTEKERLAALRRDAQVYTVNYENLPWLAKQLGSRWMFEMGVADEATRLKGFRLRQGSARARALGPYAHKHMRRWINLTGTPAENGLVDLWGQQWFIDAGRRLGRSFDAFQERFFTSKRVGDNAFSVKLIPTAFAQEHMQDMLRDCTMRIDAADHFDLIEPVRNRLEVHLPARAMAQYKAMEQEMFVRLKDGTEVEAFSSGAATMKCLQMANGSLFTDENATVWQEIHDAKIEALESVVEEAAGMPVLVAIQFRPDRDRLLKRIKGSVDLGTKSGMAAFRAGRAPVGIAHPQSIGYGVDGLQHVTNIIAFFGHWWALGPRLQMIERVGPVRQAQAGYRRPVFVHDIVAKGTIDELVMVRHETKADVLALLLDAMK